MLSMGRMLLLDQSCGTAISACLEGFKISQHVSVYLTTSLASGRAHRRQGGVAQQNRNCASVE